MKHDYKKFLSLRIPIEDLDHRFDLDYFEKDGVFSFKGYRVIIATDEEWWNIKLQAFTKSEDHVFAVIENELL